MNILYVFVSHLCNVVLCIVVIQAYEAEADNEYVIRGNPAVMKCEIPSYVSDFVYVDLWMDSDGGTYYPDDDSSNAGIIVDWPKTDRPFVVAKSAVSHDTLYPSIPIFSRILFVFATTSVIYHVFVYFPSVRQSSSNSIRRASSMSLCCAAILLCSSAICRRLLPILFLSMPGCPTMATSIDRVLIISVVFWLHVFEHMTKHARAIDSQILYTILYWFYVIAVLIFTP